MSKETTEKVLNIGRKVVYSTLAGMVAHLAQKVRDTLTTSCWLELQWIVIQPYLMFSPTVIKFQVRLHLSGRFVSWKLKKTGTEAIPSLQGPDEMHYNTKKWSPEVDEAT